MANHKKSVSASISTAPAPTTALPTIQRLEVEYQAPPKTEYAFSIVREPGGWRTKYLEVVGNTVTIVGTHEPDHKETAVAVGNRYLESKTCG